MWQNAQEAYLEGRILSASPLGLIRLLYQGAAGAVREARRHLAAGEIRQRSRAITKACDILVELEQALDYARGGEISRRLGELYFYMQQRLTEANFRQTDAPLAEVLGLLAPLLEAWDALSAQEPGQPAATAQAAAATWGAGMPEEAACCSQGWSL